MGFEASRRVASPPPNVCPVPVSVPSLLETLRALEVALHRPEVRRDPVALGALLHPEFREFGCSGRSYTRAEVLSEFAGGALAYAVWAQDFAVDELAPDLALLTYQSAHVTADGGLEAHAQRSSIWQLTPEGWLTRFHQGTPTASFGRSAG